LLVEFFSNTGCATARSIIGDFDARRVFDDATFIEFCELDWNAAHEVSSAMSAGLKNVLDEMLDVLLDVP
jgi:hypothetical protein